MIASAMGSLCCMLSSTAKRARASSKGRMMCFNASEKKPSAADLPCRCRSAFRTSYNTTVGMMMVRLLSRKAAKDSCFSSEVRYSSQPDESTRTSSEPLGVVTIVVLPLHSLRDAAEVFDGTRAMHPDRTVKNIDLQGFSRLQFELLPNFLRYHHLKFR